MTPRFLGSLQYDVIRAAADYGQAIEAARTLEEIQQVRDLLDEAIGALLAQEQVACRKRDLFTALEHTTCPRS